MKKTLKSIVVLFITIMVIKAFVIDIYYVPSSSMEETISSDSHVAVYKLKYGPKLPRSTWEIPLISKYLKRIKKVNLWSNHRIPGYGRISRGDIVLAEKEGMKLIKRVSGMPRDTLKLENGLLKVNSKSEAIKDSYLFKYTMELDKDKIFRLKDSLKNIKYLGKNKYEVYLNGKNLKNLAHIKKVAVLPDQKLKIFPENKENLWDINNYGAVIVPFKGMKIRLDSCNYELYKTVISEYENIKIERKGTSYFINGAKQKNFIFKNNYYFLLGDNRMKSTDSRIFGFIPDTMIFGNVVWNK